MKSSTPNTLRTWILTGVLTVLIISWGSFHHQINHVLLLNIFLNSKSPREEVFDELATQSVDAEDFLQRCWATEKIPHRQLVAAFLKKEAVAGSPSVSRTEPLVLACTMDADLSVRELGLAALDEAHSSRMFEAARAQIDDIDPSARLLGLDYLRKCQPKLAVPVLIGLLDDHDLQIVTGAEVGLRHWSGEDYGVRALMAIPSDEDPGGQINSNKLNLIRQGIEKRKQWWQAHEKEYPASSDSISQVRIPPGNARQPAEDFTLRDLSGKSVSLSDFRGKVVLLNFWATWCTACLAEIPELSALQDKLGDQVAIIGVALDGVADEHGHIPGEESNDKPQKESVRLQNIRARVERSVKLRGMNYRILLDPDSSVSGQYNGGELPTNVIFDKDGRVRRRFVGERNFGVFKAMIAEAGKPISSDH